MNAPRETMTPEDVESLVFSLICSHLDGLTDANEAKEKLFSAIRSLCEERDRALAFNVEYLKSNVELAGVNQALQARVEAAERDVGWIPLSDAPEWTVGRDALIGQYVPGWGWKKVSIWEPEWTKAACVARGATHWWPHLRDLPSPAIAKEQPR